MSRTTIFKLGVCALCCFAVFAFCWSLDTSTHGIAFAGGAQVAGQGRATIPGPLPYPEGAITKIEGGRIGLLTSVEMREVKGLAVGDKVQVQVGRVRKMGPPSESLGDPMGTITRIEGNKVIVELSIRPVNATEVGKFKTGEKVKIRGRNLEGERGFTPIQIP